MSAPFFFLPPSDTALALVLRVAFSLGMVMDLADMRVSRHVYYIDPCKCSRLDGRIRCACSEAVVQRLCCCGPKKQPTSESDNEAAKMIGQWEAHLIRGLWWM